MVRNRRLLSLPGIVLVMTVAAIGCASRASAPAGAAAGDAPTKTVSPEALSGFWLFEMKAGGRTIEGSLHFRVERGVLAGTLTGSDGNERELSNLALKADGVSWDFEGALGRQHAEGKIDGSSMKGKMKRAARSRSGRGSSGTEDEPEPEDQPRGGGGMGGGGGRGGGGGGGRGGAGRGGRRAPGRGAGEVTWSAYKSALAPSEKTIPTPARPLSPTPAP